MESSNNDKTNKTNKMKTIHQKFSHESNGVVYRCPLLTSTVLNKSNQYAEETMNELSSPLFRVEVGDFITADCKIAGTAVKSRDSSTRAKKKM